MTIIEIINKKEKKIIEAANHLILIVQFQSINIDNKPTIPPIIPIRIETPFKERIFFNVSFIIFRV